MKVALVFPWRPTPDRQEAWDYVSRFVPEMYPFEAGITVDTSDKVFNRSATRNEGVRWAQRHGFDVVVVCDADSVPQREPLVDAINGAYSDGLMHFPFDIAWYCGPKTIGRLLLGQNLEQLRSRIIDKCQSEGGIWVCRPETWFAAGGMDERLSGWGCDDRAFLSASRTLVGPPQKHPGVLLCLPHYRPDNFWLPEDVNILIETQSRYQNPEEMKRYVSSRSDVSSPEQGPAEERSTTISVLFGDLYR